MCACMSVMYMNVCVWEWVHVRMCARMSICITQIAPLSVNTISSCTFWRVYVRLCVIARLSVCVCVWVCACVCARTQLYNCKSVYSVDSLSSQVNKNVMLLWQFLADNATFPVTIWHIYIIVTDDLTICISIHYTVSFQYTSLMLYFIISHIFIL